jgi:hypothetical protein
MTIENENQEHPLEKVFNIESGSTPVFFDNEDVTGSNERQVSLIDPTNGEIVERSSTPDGSELDKEERLEDLHIDSQLENIHTSAMIAFEKSARMADEVDPKFSARNSEVAAQYLNIALNAVNSRIDAKHKRQKVRLAKSDGGNKGSVTNNNVIITDRNTLLDQILGSTKEGVTTYEAIRTED